MSMRLLKPRIEYLVYDTPHRVRDIMMPRSFRNTPQPSRTKQRGASLIEASIAMGLVGIAVFATISSFGGEISGKFSKEILPVIGGNPLAGLGLSGGATGDSPTQKGSGFDGAGEDFGIPPDDSVGGIGGGSDGQDGGIDQGLVGGIDASPPETQDGTDGSNRSSASSWSSEDSFVGGTDAEPPVDDASGFYPSSAAATDPTN